MKVIAAALVFVAAASKKDFPSSNFGHAHCSLAADFVDTPCDQLYDTFQSNLASWNVDTASPSGGVYNIKESADDDYIWTTRLTKNKKYTDDQLFEFQPSNGGCSIVGRSRSQSMSYYDYSVNFCNLWNVYNGTGSKFTYSTGKCGYPAKDPVTTCATY